MAILGLLSLVQASPLKVSKPQAVTAANLTHQQIHTLIQDNPPRPPILRPSEIFLPPSLPLYLPDPERNKSKDDYYLFSQQDKSYEDESPVKLTLSLDPYQVPALDSDPLAHQVQQAKKDKTSYSYNDRFDYYFPVRVVYDENRKYAEKELQLMEMKPPTISDDDEPNYYAIKPKKIPKKYQPNKKDVNHSKTADRDRELVPIDNDGLVLSDEHHTFVTTQPVERFAPAPSLRNLDDDDLNTGEYLPKYRKEESTESISVAGADDSTPPTVIIGAESKKVQRLSSGEPKSSEKLSVANDDDDQGSDSETGKRIEFQMHGFKGPNSYRFGFDTGSG